MTQGNKQLFFGTSVGETFRFDEDTFSDDGTAISIKIRTKDYYPSGLEKLSEVQRLFVFSEKAQGESISVSYDKGDYEILGSVQESKGPNRFDIGGKKCYCLSIGLDEVSSNNIKFKGFNIHFNPLAEIR